MAQGASGVVTLPVGHEIQMEPNGEAQSLEAQLRRSVGAESALMAEVGPLRERVVHLEGLLGQQKTELLQAVGKMLEPLRARLLQMGVTAEQPSELIPATLELVRMLAEEVQRLRMGTPSPVSPRPEVGGPASLVQLTDQMAAMHLTLQEMQREAQAWRVLTQAWRTGPPQREVPPGLAVEVSTPQPGTSWIVTDAQAKQIEEALLREGRGQTQPLWGR
jgi:hypothetical protein